MAWQLPVPFLHKASSLITFFAYLWQNTLAAAGRDGILGLWHCGCGLEICTGSKLKPEPGPYPRSSDPTRPDPSGTVKFKARTRPEIPPPPPPPPPTTNNKKKKEKGCISRLHAKKRINQGSDISQTFTSYESLWTSGAAVAYILPSLWILYGQEDDDRANYGHFLSVKAR